MVLKAAEQPQSQKLRDDPVLRARKKVLMERLYQSRIVLYLK
jgi:hypothetical protein